MNWYRLILLLVGGYLIGSIPMGYIIGKLFYRVDIRSAGSGNIGATNALRLFGTRTGIIILILDMLKGVCVVLVARAWFADYPWVVSASVLLAILGHIYTIFLRFKGGKGVATAGGAFLALAPLEALIALGIFVIVVAISRYVSLGSILAALGFAVVVVIRQLAGRSPDWFKVALCVAVVAMIIIRHRANIGRLMQGNENRLSFSSKGKN